jgi:hypothetical protein
MSSDNSYGAPQDDSVGATQDTASLEKVASGQKLIIYSILLNFVGLAGQHSFGLLLILVLSVVVLVMSIVGIVRLCTGLGYSAGVMALCIIGSLIPVVNLIVLVVLSMQATRRLRDAGYKVGLLGASR